ncbi:hypothetical protein P152DRAFT_440784 [Eremomyces bilateralis CBS 781.70]|uniref:Uncharacterized protein n=1 Tax=Eremomyces bilateralis CBS 781.70 TaxID=1392243 RepID=A0A6G1FWR9_9PEZI|nr:uncharacterized protein P152DRAFT_440784 [Eremomyces bilateralis CBS 781.70]KAF1810130.1 hypothetical protein P152DRAFT_440784 [Eremomyces bilateralis CBS 781.70]
MSSIIPRAAFRAAPRLRAPFRPSTALRDATAASEREHSKTAMKKEAKLDPELYILAAVMVGAGGLAGWYFSTNLTSGSSESPVGKKEGSEPWKTGTDGKYQYYPGGDASKGARDAPSAVNESIIPNVTLPKSLHDKYNKYGKDISEW